MKLPLSSFVKLVGAAVCALTLGSCNRAEYALLPKGSSYYGVSRAATPVPVAAEATTSEAPVDHAVVETPAAAAAPAAVPNILRTAKAPAVTAPAAAVATGAAISATRLNLAQRLAMAKISKKLEKATRPTKFTRHGSTAATQRLDGKLRQGLILLVVGLLVGIVGGAVGGSIGGVIGLLGLILAIIGIVLIVLYLLDEL